MQFHTIEDLITHFKFLKLSNPEKGVDIEQKTNVEFFQISQSKIINLIENNGVFEWMPDEKFVV